MYPANGQPSEAPTNKLKVEFGKPYYDWLPVTLVLGDFHLVFKASGVLSDPLAELVSCLLLITQGVDASVSWWLEPAGFSFQFDIEPHGIQLTIIESEDFHAVRPLSKRQLLRVSASYEAVVLPFWRALRKLHSLDFTEANWYPLPLEKLEKLTQLIKTRKSFG